MTSVFGSQKSSKNLEIILDSPFAVFYGDTHEAEPVPVTGTLVLNNTDHMNVRGVKINLQGRWRVGWTAYGSPKSGNPSSTQVIREKGILLSEEKQFIPAAGAASTTHRIAPGRHEWRFEFLLDPKLPESVEGLAGNYVIYNLSAEIDRGYMSKSLVATKHLRVVRTLSRDMAETVPFPYSNEDTWADKIKYHIYIPSRYFAFGTSIPVQFTLIPLRKGVTIGKIKMEVIERVTLETDKNSSNWQTTTLSDKTVAKMDQQMPQDSSSRLVEESTGIADESYHFKAMLPLQRSLNACRQSVNSDSIKIFHNLKIYVNIHNPDGHISQLCLRNLIHLYISPHMQISDNQIMTTSPQVMNDRILGLDIPGADVPPTYGTHVLDQLYDDIDMSGFHSGMATPAHFVSRQHSTENLAARLAAALPSENNSDSNSSRSSSMTDSAATQLQDRLSALHDLGLTTPDTTVSTISRNHSPSPDVQTSRSGMQSGVSSRRHSGIFSQQRRRSNTAPGQPLYLGGSMDQETGLATPPHTNGQSSSYSTTSTRPDLSILQSGHRSARPPSMAFGSELSRVPSYNTAIRTPYIPHSPNLEGLPETSLPSYDYVVSLTTAPNSPNISPFPPTPPLDTDSAGFPFNSDSSQQANKTARTAHRASSDISTPSQSEVQGAGPSTSNRRNSNPPLPPNASRSGLIMDPSSQRRRSSLMMSAGSLSGFLHGMGMRSGSQ